MREVQLEYELKYPVREIDQIRRACDAGESLPPGDPRHYDFSRLRGGDVLTELGGVLRLPLGQGAFHHRVLCGHRGSGKLTELRALKVWADENGFFAIWIEVDLHFGLIELQFSDLYLLAAQAVAREMNELGLPLPAEALKEVVEWFAKITEEDLNKIESQLSMEAGAKLSPLPSWMPFARLFANFSAGVKAGSNHHTKIRQELRQYPNKLIELTNVLLKSASYLLRESGRSRGLLLLFDNLDRFEPESVRRLLMDGCSLIQPLACHAIFTMPIVLHYLPDSPYQDSYGGHATTLPMPALRKPRTIWKETIAKSAYSNGAVAEMLEALKRRIDVGTLFAKSADARLLVKLCGGCIRELLHLVNLAHQKSFTSLDEPLMNLTSQGVLRAISQYRSDLTQGLLEIHYRRLAAIAQGEVNSQELDEPMLQLLRRRIVFEYCDGKDRWFDVHPMVIETEGFRRAFTQRSRLGDD